jgi:hypothetical protein
MPHLEHDPRFTEEGDFMTTLHVKSRLPQSDLDDEDEMMLIVHLQPHPFMTAEVMMIPTSKTIHSSHDHNGHIGQDSIV